MEDVQVYNMGDVQGYNMGDVQVYNMGDVQVYSMENVQVYNMEDVQVYNMEDVQVYNMEDVQVYNMVFRCITWEMSMCITWEMSRCITWEMFRCITWEMFSGSLKCNAFAFVVQPQWAVFVPLLNVIHPIAFLSVTRRCRSNQAVMVLMVVPGVFSGGSCRRSPPMWVMPIQHRRNIWHILYILYTQKENSWAVGE